MPTYEYLCKTCGHKFEQFQSITADPLRQCPVEECILEDEDKKGSGEVQRLLSGGAGLVFKGEGFYLTDYVRKKDGGSSDKGSSSSSSSSKNTDTKNSSSSSDTSKGSSSDSGT